MAHSAQFLKLVNEAKKKIKETNVAEVKRRTDAGEKFLLVDVREDNEWTKGHLPGAALVAENLQKMGYDNVESMGGGWRGWLEAGLPIARD